MHELPQWTNHMIIDRFDCRWDCAIIIWMRISVIDGRREYADQRMIRNILKLVAIWTSVVSGSLIIYVNIYLVLDLQKHLGFSIGNGSYIMLYLANNNILW